jgi:flavodoxin I
MKALILYDSAYGNTEEIAQAIGKGVGPDTRVERIEGIMPNELGQFDTVVLGSPTQAGRPMGTVKAFLKNIPEDALKGIAVTGFDTRIDWSTQNFVMKFWLGILGTAAGRIARELEKKGGRLVVQPEGFLVTGTEGPLTAGEVDRATTWASTIVHAHTASA